MDITKGELNEGLSVRFVEEKDLPEMLAIYTPYVEKTAISFEYAAPSPEEFRERFIKYSVQYPWLVCEREGKLLGYAYGSPNYTRAAYQWTVETSIYLAEGSRGMGVGKFLYDSLFALLTSQNYYWAYAIISGENRASINFHLRCGFCEIGTYRNTGYKLGRWHDIVLLEKELRPVEIPPRAVIPIAELGFLAAAD